MYNRIVCALSGQTIYADHKSTKSDVTIVFNGSSIGEEIGKVVTPFPFIFDFKFVSGKFEPLTKKDGKEFRRFVYHFLKNYKVEVKSLKTKETTEYDFKKGHPSREDIEAVCEQILSYPNDEYEIFFKSSKFNINFSLTPFISTKKQFNIIKENDFNINYLIKNKNDLFPFLFDEFSDIYNDLELEHWLDIRDKEEDEAKDFIYKIIFNNSIKNNFKGFKRALFEMSLFLGTSPYRYVGLNGKHKQAPDSLNKMLDVYWTIYKLTEFNINLSNNSVPYPNSILNDQLVEYHEKRLNVLKEELKN